MEFLKTPHEFNLACHPPFGDFCERLLGYPQLVKQDGPAGLIAGIEGTQQGELPGALLCDRDTSAGDAQSRGGGAPQIDALWAGGSPGLASALGCRWS